MCECIDRRHDKVQDHGHLSGIFHKAAQSICNFYFKLPNFIKFFSKILKVTTDIFLLSSGIRKGKVGGNKETYFFFEIYGRLVVDVAGKQQKVIFKIAIFRWF